MKKKKIVYIQPNGSFSGAAISLRFIINKLDRNKYTPYVIICSEGPLREYYENMGVEVYLAPYKTFTTTPSPPLFSSNFLYNIIALFGSNTISDILKKIEPDIVHVNDKSALLAGVHAFKMGYKVIWHLRSTYYGYKSYFHYFISKYLIGKFSSHLIAISEDEVDCFQKSSKISIVYNSIDFSKVKYFNENGSTFREEFGILENEMVIGMIGNLDAQKGLWNFIEAASIVLKSNIGRKIKFVIVAPIPKNVNYGWRGNLGLINTKSAYQLSLELVKQLGVESSFIFTDRRYDMENVMLGLDVISAVYNMHAIGRPAIEGAAIGKPVIVNQGHTGKSRMVNSGETGFIVQKERPELLANLMLTLVNNKDLRERIGKQAYAYSRKMFDDEFNCRIIENIYDDLINKN